MSSCLLSGEMKIFMHHIYEFQKGIRSMVLCTLAESDKYFAINKLKKLGIDYLEYEISSQKVNIFFGAKGAIEVAKMICTRPLNKLTAEEDFILGTLLGYSVSEQCSRYSKRKAVRNTA